MRVQGIPTALVKKSVVCAEQDGYHSAVDTAFLWGLPSMDYTLGDSCLQKRQR